jgi:hypothetical protein
LRLVFQSPAGTALILGEERQAQDDFGHAAGATKGVVMKTQHRVRIRGRAAVRRTLLLLAALLSVLLLSACSTGGGRHGNRRGSVSDTAARAAHDGKPGRGTGRTRTKTDHNDQSTEHRVAEDEEDEEDVVSSFLADLLIGLFTSDDDDDDEVYHPEDIEPSTAESAFMPPQYAEIGGPDESDEDPDRTDMPSGDSTGLARDKLIVWLSRAQLAGDTIARVSSISVMYSASFNRRWRGHMGFYYGENRKGSQRLVQDGINEIWEYGVEMGAREYLTPNHTSMGFYLLFGLRAGAMRWNYAWADPVPGEDRVASDGVYVFQPYLGIGKSVVQFKSFALGASVCWGPRIMPVETFQNYHNDLFRNVGELRLNIEASIVF